MLPSASFGELGLIIGVALFWVVLFFVARRLVLWYWRINEAVELLKSQRGLLLAIAERLDKDEK